MAQLLLSMEDGDGRPFEANPREVLRRVLERYTARGLTPVVAVELEFYLLDAELDADGQPRTSINPATGERNTHARRSITCRTSTTTRTSPTRSPTPAARRAFRPTPRWPSTRRASSRSTSSIATTRCSPATTRSASSARSRPSPSARACSPASWPSPSCDQAGSGLHVHVSVLDRDGDNIFACTPDAPTDTLRHAIAGLQRRADGLHADVRAARQQLSPLRAQRLRAAERLLGLQQPHRGDAHPAQRPGQHPHRAPHRRRRRQSLPGHRRGARRHPARARDTAAIRARRWSATPTSRPRRARCSGATRSPTSMASDFVARRTSASSFRHIFGQQKLKEMRSFYTEVTTLESTGTCARSEPATSAPRRRSARARAYDAARRRCPPLPPLRRRRAAPTSASSAPASPACRRRSNWRRPGCDVVVLEAERVGWGASGRNGGQAIFGFGCDQSKIAALVGMRGLAAAVRLVAGRRAADPRALRALRHRLRLARRPRARADQAAPGARAARPGSTTWRRTTATRCEWWERERLRAQLASERYLGALYDPRSGHLHPLEYTLRARARGAVARRAHLRRTRR